MGVPGLLQYVRSVVQQVHLSEFRGRTLAVDVSSWLHKGAIVCAPQLVAGEPTDMFLNYPLKMVELFQKHGVVPLLVFDGGSLPVKQAVHRERIQDRARNRQKGLELRGCPGREAEAEAALRKSVGVSPEMAHQLVEALRALGVAFYVAPYEADAQLAFLVREGYAFAAVSEDSDLLAFGCPRVIYKLDAGSAVGELIELDHLRNAERDGRHIFDGAWDGEWAEWRSRLIVDMCVLAGNDYLPSLPQVGIGKAHAAVRSKRDLGRAAQELGRACRLPPLELRDYAEKAKRVRLVYLHQRVFDPRSGCVTHLTPFSGRSEMAQGELDGLVGPFIPPPLAKQICREARLNPVTLMAFEPLPRHSHRVSSDGAAESGAPRPGPLYPGAQASVPDIQPRCLLQFIGGIVLSSTATDAPAAKRARCDCGVSRVPEHGADAPAARSRPPSGLVGPRGGAQIPADADAAEERRAQGPATFPPLRPATLPPLRPAPLGAELSRSAALAAAAAGSTAPSQRVGGEDVRAAHPRASSLHPRTASLHPRAASPHPRAASPARSAVPTSHADDADAVARSRGPDGVWWSVAEMAAATGDHELLRLLGEEGSVLSKTPPTGTEQLWLLHASLSHWIFSEGGLLGASPRPLLLRSALKLLTLLRDWLPDERRADAGAASPGEVRRAAIRTAYTRTMQCGWRQALLQPLREQPPAWDRLQELLRVLPPEVAALRDEMRHLRPGSGHPSSSQSAIAQAGANWHRAVSAFSASHPSHELVRALAELLPAVQRLLPRPRLEACDLRRGQGLSSAATPQSSDTPLVDASECYVEISTESHVASMCM